jgi:wee1-like protein kinase
MYAVKRTVRKLQTERERREALKEVQAMAGLGNGSGNGHEHVVRYFGTCCVSQIQAHCLPVHDD